jgi:hypothetical protein
MTMLKMMTVGAAALAMAAPAAAAPATVTVTGTVMSGFDPVGTFGAAGANLAGQAFSAVFTIEAKPASTALGTDSSAYLFGRDAASPLSAALTIGSATYNFAGSFSGLARASDAAGQGGTDLLYYMVEDTDPALLPPDNTLFYVGFDTLRDVIGQATYGAADVAGLSLADNAKGQVRIANRDAATGRYGASTFADLAVTSIRAQMAAPVPEPATWAMMVTGFAMAGVALRRRRRVDARMHFA